MSVQIRGEKASGQALDLHLPAADVNSSVAITVWQERGLPKSDPKTVRETYVQMSSISLAFPPRSLHGPQLTLKCQRVERPAHSRASPSHIYGVYCSALLNSLTASLPPALSTWPLVSTVEVWPERALLMLPVEVHVPVVGS